MGLALGRLARASMLAAVVGLWVLGPGIASAAPPVITGVRVEAPERVTVGDRIHLVIGAEVDTGTQLSLPPGTIPPELALAGTPQVSRQGISPGREEVTIRVELAPFFLGRAPLEGLRIRYTDAAGASGEVVTPGFEIAVTPTITGGAAEPRGLKAQAAFPTVGMPAWVAITAAALAIALVLTLAALAWRRRRRSLLLALPPEPVAGTVGPEDRARHELEGAAAGNLADRNYGAYYAVLSRTVRTYLTERFGFPAFALTTTELQAQMVRQGMDRWQARIVGGLLEQCDAVVFAGYRPAPERAELDLTAAFEIVEMSRLIDAAPVEAGVLA